MSATDIQVAGTHYRDMKIQPVEFIQDNLMGFCEGNVIKYTCRWRAKNGIEDLRKARHYIELIQDNSRYCNWFHLLRRAWVISVTREDHPMSADDFIQANGIENPEAGVIRHIWIWSVNGNPQELESAMGWMKEAIDAADVEAT